MLLDVVDSLFLVGVKIRVLLVLLYLATVLLRLLLGFGEVIVVFLGEGLILGQETQGVTEGKGFLLLGRLKTLILEVSEF